MIGSLNICRAIAEYKPLSDFGLSVPAAFCRTVSESETVGETEILPIEALSDYCASSPISIGMIAESDALAQDACNRFCECGIRKIWTISSRTLYLPQGVSVRYVNPALSLALLKMQP